MADISIIIKVGNEVRAWSDHHRVHKMGWLSPGDIIHAVAQYANWYRFEILEGCVGLLPVDDNYTEYWVCTDELEIATEPEPEPEEPNAISDAELGMALRILVSFLRGE